MMVQLLIMGFVIMIPKTDTGTVICGIITLGINSGAYVAEIARSGIMSVNAGQAEAGRSLGLNYVQTMWYIVIPQALKNILPALGNEMITLFEGYVACVGYHAQRRYKAGSEYCGKDLSALYSLHKPCRDLSYYRYNTHKAAWHFREEAA